MATAPIDDREFVALLDRADRGRRLSFAQTRRLAELYRVHTTQLGQMRDTYADPDAVRYLNSLCIRAYTYLHQVPALRRRRSWFWTRELPVALGRTWRLQLLAWALLFGGAWMGGQAVAADPDTLPELISPRMHSSQSLQRLYHSEASRQEFLMRTELGLGEKSMFSASLFANNTRVGMLSFAVGPLLVLPTALLLLYNGATLGAFGALFMGTGQQLDFLAWLLPHGVPELLAIVLCATGGLAMGAAVLAPGRRTRVEALRAAASDGFALVISAVPLFVVAAFIESFVRQSLMSTGARFVVAGGVSAALLLYVLWTVRLARRQHAVETGFLNAHTSPRKRR